MSDTKAEIQNTEAGSGHGEKYSRLKDAALAALLTHGSITTAAKAAGLDAETLRAWTKRADFANDYRAVRREVVVAAQSKAATLLTESVGVLAKIIRDKKASPSSRIAAVRLVVEMTQGLLEDDNEARLAELEKLAGLTKSEVKHE